MTRRNRRPNPLVVGTALWHLAGGAALALQPHTWPAILGLLVANHALVAGAGIHPRCTLLGPNFSRLDVPGDNAETIALTFDDGPDPDVTPRILEILDRFGCRATFFMVGERAAAHPDLARAAVEAGHALGNHSWSHPTHFFFLPPGSLARQIDRTQAVLEDVSGVRPALFRAPAGIRSPLLDPLLAERGLRLVSWSRRAFDTVDGRAPRILKRLVSGLGSRDIVLLHDGGAAHTATGDPVVLDVLPKLLETVRDRGMEIVPVA